MPTKANRAIGSLDFSDEERQKLAIKSRTWSCETCGLIKNLLRHPNNSSNKFRDPTMEPSTSSSHDNNYTDNDDSEAAHSESSSSNKIRDMSNDSKISSDKDSSLEKIQQESLDLNESNSKCQGTINSINKTETATFNSHQPAREQYEQARHRENSNEILENLNDRQRSSYPPLVFKSICILLSLLLLRRVVLILQA